MNQLACSVVIPSHNRAARLELVLDALASQTVSLDCFEVIVILDGSTDASAAVLQRVATAAPFPLRWRQQECTGPAAARNRGAAMASSPVVLFLDDDVVPEPALISNHLRHHGSGERVAVVGDYPVARRPDSLYERDLWAWWEDANHRRAQPGHRGSYRDFCAGNVSLRRSDLFAAGGFDESFPAPAREDYELGYRLLRAGVRFIADRDARGAHHHPESLPRVLRRSRAQGASDVRLGQIHPELRGGLHLMWPRDPAESAAFRLGFLATGRGAVVAWWTRRALRMHERLGRRGHWREAFSFLRDRAYWCGVRDVLGSLAALQAYRAGATPPPVHEIEIGGGLPEPLPPLWIDGPNRIVVKVFGRRLGEFVLEGPLDEPIAPSLAREISHHFRAELLAMLGSLPAAAVSGRVGVSDPA